MVNKKLSPQKGEAPSPIMFLSQKLSEISRRTRMLEERTGRTIAKADIIGQTQIKNIKAFREDMNVLGIQDSDIFQVQLVEYGKERTKKNSPKNPRRK